MNSKTRNLTSIGVFCAFAYVLTNLGNVIPIRFAGFLSFDPKDVAIVIAGFALGPWATLAISLVVSFIEMITISGTGPIGFVMNVISSMCFAFIPAFVYKNRRTFKSALGALIVSSIITSLVMLLCNYLLTPVYLAPEPEQIVEVRLTVAKMLLPTFLPFNMIKCFVNTFLVAILYKPVVKALRKINLAPPSKRKSYEQNDEN